MAREAKKSKTALALVGFLTGFGAVVVLEFWAYGFAFLKNGETLAVGCFIGTIVGFFCACLLSSAGASKTKKSDIGYPENNSWDKSYASHNDWVSNGCKPQSLSD